MNRRTLALLATVGAAVWGFLALSDEVGDSAPMLIVLGALLNSSTPAADLVLMVTERLRKVGREHGASDDA